jgi:hypothetical protein
LIPNVGPEEKAKPRVTHGATGKEYESADGLVSVRFPPELRGSGLSGHDAKAAVAGLSVLERPASIFARFAINQKLYLVGLAIRPNHELSFIQKIHLRSIALVRRIPD